MILVDKYLCVQLCSRPYCRPCIFGSKINCSKKYKPRESFLQRLPLLVEFVMKSIEACYWSRTGRGGLWLAALRQPVKSTGNRRSHSTLTHSRRKTSFNHNEGNRASSGWTMWKSNRSKGKNQTWQIFCRIITILTTTITPLLSLFSVLGNHFWWTWHRPHRLLHCKYFLVPSLNPKKRCQLYNFAGHLRPAVGEDQRVLQRSFWWKVCAQGCPCRLGAWHHGFRQEWTFWTSL